MSTVRISEATGGEYRLFEVPICEYAMRGSPGPHPTLLVFTNIKCSHAVMVDMSTMRISEGPGVNIVYSRARYIRNTLIPVARLVGVIPRTSNAASFKPAAQLVSSGVQLVFPTSSIQHIPTSSEFFRRKKVSLKGPL